MEFFLPGTYRHHHTLYEILSQRGFCFLGGFLEHTSNINSRCKLTCGLAMNCQRQLSLPSTTRLKRGKFPCSPIRKQEVGHVLPLQLRDSPLWSILGTKQNLLITARWLQFFLLTLACLGGQRKTQAQQMLSANLPPPPPPCLNLTFTKFLAFKDSLLSC